MDFLSQIKRKESEIRTQRDLEQQLSNRFLLYNDGDPNKPGFIKQDSKLENMLFMQ